MTKKNERAAEQAPTEPTGILAGHLRRSIEGCGLSQYEIAKRAGIAPQQLYRFMNEGKTLTIDTVDKILRVIDENFGLRLMGLEMGRDEMARSRQSMLAWLEQLQDSIEDLKALVMHGPKSDDESAPGED
jgi:plasmid maintenance system antidote protein VapI